MLLEEYLSTIETAPRTVQKALTQILEIEKSITEEKKILDKEMSQIMEALEEDVMPKSLSLIKGEIDNPLKRINTSYLRILDADRKKLAILMNLHQKLEQTSEGLKDSSNEFKESIAKGALTQKLGRITKLLEQKIDSDDSDDEENIYCLCKRPMAGEMVVCDNNNCPVQWYHCACVGLKTTPKKKWVCATCQKE
ncbi:hypothetical protein NEDG_00731 [Nematocida displodere]|uniref:PHD-type domain-containing protein n=1 Tax=Nematocida displodere TaxID=1805483 RepID=A0A177ECP9_9MICR|nr:hypothetical protein NEDG_00731 [Nematocida displodere]